MALYSDLALFGSVSMVTLTPGVNDAEVGTVRREGDEEYIFVYNNGNSQASVGRGVICSAVTGYSVTVSSITNVDMALGVVKHATFPTAAYGWALIRGFGPAKIVADSIVAAGDMLVLGVDGAWTNKSVSTGIVAPAQGKVMVATISGGVADAFFKIF